MKHPWAEGIDGVWHRRSDDFWDNDIRAKVRAHAVCGQDIWSCHVSEFDPREIGPEEVMCKGCTSNGGSANEGA